MTTLATRTRQIGDLEDFDVQFVDKKTKAPIDPKTNGYPGYKFEKKARGDTTVGEWQKNRAEKTYKGAEVVVLKGDGSVAGKNTKLSTVRKSYEEEEAPAGAATKAAAAPKKGKS